MVLLAAKPWWNLSGHVSLLLGGLVSRGGGGGLSVGHSSPLLCIVPTTRRNLRRNAGCTRTGGRGGNRARAGRHWAWGGEWLGTGGLGWFWHWNTQIKWIADGFSTIKRERQYLRLHTLKLPVFRVIEEQVYLNSLCIVNPCIHATESNLISPLALSYFRGSGHRF